MQTETYSQVPLVGTFFRGREAVAIVEAYTPGIKLELRREPDNKYDPNAIQVLDTDDGDYPEGVQVGYVSRDVAVWVADKLDSGWTVQSCVVTEMSINSKNKPMPIMEIILELREEEAEDSDLVPIGVSTNSPSPGYLYGGW